MDLQANLEETVKIVELTETAGVARILTHRDLHANEDVLGYLVIGKGRLPKRATLGDAKARSNGEIGRIFSFADLTQAAHYGIQSLHLLFLV